MLYICQALFATIFSPLLSLLIVLVSKGVAHPFGGEYQSIGDNFVVYQLMDALAT